MTPYVGTLIGEYIFTPIRKWAREKDKLRWYDMTLLFLTDPIGVASEEVSRLFGVNATVNLHPPRTTSRQYPSEMLEGMETNAPLQNPSKPAWGLYLNFRW